MSTERAGVWAERVSFAARRMLTGAELMGAAMCLGAGLALAQSWLALWRHELDSELAALAPALERAHAALETSDHLYALRARDLEATKGAMVGLARKQKAYYEDKLALGQERRSLDKQLELMETGFSLEEGRLRLRRGDKLVEEFEVGALLRWPAAPAAKIPARVQVGAKEYYAHPERGKVDLKDGSLSWTPPQVGTVARQDALGRFVVFAGDLVIHLPPADRAAHEGYAHLCLPLAAKSAGKAYDALFIGARIQLEPAKR